MSIRMFCGVAAFFAQVVFAQDVTLGNLKISHPWARATGNVAHHGAIYFKVENKGNVEDVLLSASNPKLAENIELNDHVHEKGVMRMRAVPSIQLPAHMTTWLKPHGYHVMLMGLKQPLQEGTTIPLTLTFKRAGTVNVNVKVEALTSNPDM
ncbi:MAG: copper chaperone PCu(A)C [Pseudomonadota bacterium]